MTGPVAFADAGNLPIPHRDDDVALAAAAAIEQAARSDGDRVSGACAAKMTAGRSNADKKARIMAAILAAITPARSAMIGSTRVALRAGTIPEMAATTIRAVAAVASAIGSVVVTP